MADFDSILAAHRVTPNDVRISLGITAQAVSKWRCGYPMSIKSALEIERKFGIPKHELRPDIWDPPPVKGRRRTAAEPQTV
ncbi:MAG TPA: hypothetical protein VK741_21840 [Acetobacteraceae bacterium]|jgi:hypothetical protein|nr:hypothetical protein [Acetobacteraceae bacterium]